VAPFRQAVEKLLRQMKKLSGLSGELKENVEFKAGRDGPAAAAEGHRG